MISGNRMKIPVRPLHARTSGMINGKKCRLRWKPWVLGMSHRKMKVFRICFRQKTGSGTITVSFSGVFTVLKEEIEVDPDSFDPVFYSYGMSLYGNMPLIEPSGNKRGISD